MRPKFNTQQELDFSPSTLKITNQHHNRYEKISQVLDDNPKIVEALHQDVCGVSKKQKRDKGGRNALFSTETILRILIVKQFENLSYRDAVIRIDDSSFFRAFVGLKNKPMMDYPTLCKMLKKIRDKTWHKINDLLLKYAIGANLISGDELRRDSTVYESNIHYPTDSSLLWDVYRTLARFIDKVREVEAKMVGTKRLNTKEVKAIYFQINRQVSKKSKAENKLKSAYLALMGHVEKILLWSDDVCETIRRTRTDYTWDTDVFLQSLVDEYEKFIELGIHVMDQANRRVLNGESVPNEEKLFSIFEPHVELIKRGKAGKNIEFGHVVNLQQVHEKFITGYDVFKKKPVEYDLVDSTLAKHEKMFGEWPEVYADDKGGYESMDKLRELEAKIPLVSICKKGKRNAEEDAREHTSEFRLAQKFRAGIEGSISFLKRMFGLAKCYYRSFKTFTASVGSIIFAHNLTILTRLL